MMLPLVAELPAPSRRDPYEPIHVSLYLTSGVVVQMLVGEETWCEMANCFGGVGICEYVTHAGARFLVRWVSVDLLLRAAP